jgi:hypothetical protein
MPNDPAPSDATAREIAAALRTHVLVAGDGTQPSRRPDDAIARLMRAAAEALDPTITWQPIETAPLDEWVLVYAAPAHGLDGFICTARYHSDGGWCVDELRHTTHWMPLPEPPHAE